jgi:hypothetical protein
MVMHQLKGAVDRLRSVDDLITAEPCEYYLSASKKEEVKR